ncbi:hypothetical protein GCM10009117_04540 [Gangjinia marincola]|uniref:Deacylase n=1 Tax=Gangjinia marincola TaxID=578463 RepID=A0ABN1ME16_9FLAO
MNRFISLLLGVLFFSANAQEEKVNPFSITASYGYGTLLEHSPDIGHLITAHPTVLFVSYDRKTFGDDNWSQAFNYPDFGASFAYQNTGNVSLGDLYGLYGHFNFYFFQRHLMLGLGTGMAYATNPYDADDNFRNTAYGTRFTGSTYIKLVGKKEQLLENLGVEGGLTLIHYSNGNFKAPNNSTNSVLFNVGLNYVLGKDNKAYIQKEDSTSYREPIRLVAALRGGFHSSDVIGSGQYPFYIITGMAEKRLSRKSAVQAGAEIFFSEMLEEFIRYRGIAFPEDNIQGDEDAKRAGIFIGYRLIFNKISTYANAGYYVYYPVDFEGRFYTRLGLQYDINDQWFTSVSVKSHAANAEAVELTLGYRFKK